MFDEAFELFKKLESDEYMAKSLVFSAECHKSLDNLKQARLCLEKAYSLNKIPKIYDLL